MKTNYHIKFSITREDRFNKLHALFQELKKSKSIDSEDDIWLTFFDEESKKMMFELIDKQSPIWSENTFEGSLETIDKDIEWLIELLSYIDANFIDIENLHENSEYILYYEPLGFPFGGTDSIHMMIQSFNGHVISDSLNKN